MKFRKILIVGLIVVIAGLIAMEYICNQGKVCKCSAYSTNKTSAIEEGFYIDTYVPLNETYAVSDLRDTIHFDSAWSEHTWQFSKGLCLLRHKIKGDGFNICIPFTTTNSDVNTYSFTLAPIIKNTVEEGISSYVGGRINFGVDKLSDTIRLIIKEDRNIDTILFVRTKNGG
ncbi:MAG: hypothetical protein HZB42_15270 [Sphingobacteriales bacterium]|nr:hypothetical protein [Sphingobacteriales bacterium]